jgi:hypothetical protein
MFIGYYSVTVDRETLFLTSDLKIVLSGSPEDNFNPLKLSHAYLRFSPSSLLSLDCAPVCGTAAHEVP